MQGFIRQPIIKKSNNYSDFDIIDFTHDESLEFNVVNWINENEYINTYLKQSEIKFLTQTEILTPNQESLVTKYLRWIRISPSIPNNISIASRLHDLNTYAKEEDELGVGINTDSLLTFFKFINKYVKIKLPSITLTPENKIFAIWKESNNQLLNLHFRKFDDIGFTTFYWDRIFKNKVRRITGDTSIEMIDDTVINIFANWIFD